MERRARMEQKDFERMEKIRLKREVGLRDFFLKKYVDSDFFKSYWLFLGIFLLDA
jgi:hypothetical protein